MSDPEAVSPVGDYSKYTLSGIFPSLLSKLDLRRQLGTIKGDLEKIEERLRFQVQEFDPGIHGYISYALDSNGKRIRPALVLLAAHATGKVTPKHLDLAVIVELSCPLSSGRPLTLVSTVTLEVASPSVSLISGSARLSPGFRWIEVCTYCWNPCTLIVSL